MYYKQVLSAGTEQSTERRAYSFYWLLQCLPSGLSNVHRKRYTKEVNYTAVDGLDWNPEAATFSVLRNGEPNVLTVCMLQTSPTQASEEEHSVEKPGPMLNNKQLQGFSEWLCLVIFSE